MTRALACLFSLLLLTRCALISGSLNSLSDSSAGAIEAVTSPLESSFTSSGGRAGGGVSYRRDVEAYTVAFLEDTSLDGTFLRGLGQVAEVHGITDWEAVPETVEGISLAVQAVESPGVGVARLQRELAPLDPAFRTRAFGPTGRDDA